jgi:hypothetical protein
MGFKDLMKKGFNKTKDFVKDEIKKNKELKEKIQKMSDKELKNLAINKGQPYEDAWLQRQKNKKRLREREKRI